MSRVTDTTSLAAGLRRLLRAGGDVAAGRLPGPSIDPRGQLVAQPAGQTQAAQTLGQMIARRVSAIDRSDPDRHGKAFRAFLEAVLLSEFGTGHVNDPAFQALVDRVHDQIRGDQALEADAVRLARGLLDSGPDPNLAQGTGGA